VLLGAASQPAATRSISTWQTGLNLLSATPSGGWLQLAGHPGARVALGTRAQMFWLEDASSLAPGRRPRTTLSPGLVA
jgi:gamma-glutamyltranspeptidase/glutathione hydrolase